MMWRSGFGPRALCLTPVVFVTGVKQKARGPNLAPHVILCDPLMALKTSDHLFFKKVKKNIPCFYFEGFK